MGHNSKMTDCDQKEEESAEYQASNDAYDENEHLDQDNEQKEVTMDVQILKDDHVDKENANPHVNVNAQEDIEIDDMIDINGNDNDVHVVNLSADIPLQQQPSNFPKRPQSVPWSAPNRMKRRSRKRNFASMDAKECMGKADHMGKIALNLSSCDSVFVGPARKRTKTSEQQLKLTNT